jgi:hypothetical protein
MSNAIGAPFGPETSCLASMRSANLRWSLPAYQRRASNAGRAPGTWSGGNIFNDASSSAASANSSIPASQACSNSALNCGLATIQARTVDAIGLPSCIHLERSERPSLTQAITSASSLSEYFVGAPAFGFSRGRTGRNCQHRLRAPAPPCHCPDQCASYAQPLSPALPPAG